MVAALRASGLSQRAIATATGLSKGTVGRELSGAPNGAPETVVGTDGKSYGARRSTYERPAFEALRHSGPAVSRERIESRLKVAGWMSLDEPIPWMDVLLSLKLDEEGLETFAQIFEWNVAQPFTDEDLYFFRLFAAAGHDTFEAALRSCWDKDMSREAVAAADDQQNGTCASCPRTVIVPVGRTISNGWYV